MSHITNKFLTTRWRYGVVEMHPNHTHSCNGHIWLPPSGPTRPCGCKFSLFAYLGSMQNVARTILKALQSLALEECLNQAFLWSQAPAGRKESACSHPLALAVQCLRGACTWFVLNFINLLHLTSSNQHNGVSIHDKLYTKKMHIDDVTLFPLSVPCFVNC
jgi:hypothetical protein